MPRAARKPATKPATDRGVAHVTRKANRYASTCLGCGARVAAHAGYLARATDDSWGVVHTACTPTTSGVIVVQTSSGWEGTQNRGGRCIDAPCCGCCTF